MNTSLLTQPETDNSIEGADVLEYAHPELVARLKRKHGLSHKAATLLFKDTLRFLFLCSVSEAAISPTPEIDKGWHEFLMYTGTTVTSA